MESRYGNIKTTCSAWKGVLAKAHRLKTSGQTEDDVIMTAKQYYLHEKGKPFKDEHCWVILSRCPKWYLDTSSEEPPIRPMGSQPSTFLDLEETSPDVEASPPPPPPSRPEGRDKARNRAKGKVKDDNTEDLQAQTNELVFHSSILQERHKTKVLFESQMMQHTKEKMVIEKEQWEYTKREKDLAMRRSELDMRDQELIIQEREFSFRDKEMELLERDLTNLTPRKRKVLKNRQDAIYVRHSGSGSGSGARDDNEPADGSGGVTPNFEDSYRPLF
ncbi:hypothetical protein LINGRAHAP2_LOCUS10755 [Linum grandiflorum]